MKLITLSNNMVASVDDADFEFLNVYKWSAQLDKRTWYARTSLKWRGKWRTKGMHNLLLKKKANRVVDHIDGDGLNNQRTNLRYVTNRQNSWNSRKQIDSKSPYKGISFHTQSGKWRAHIYLPSTHMSLGLYQTPEEAARVYDAAVKVLFREWARPNFL